MSPKRTKRIDLIGRILIASLTLVAVVVVAVVADPVVAITSVRSIGRLGLRLMNCVHPCRRG
jgi:CBS-domain-containing membrane protein